MSVEEEFKRCFNLDLIGMAITSVDKNWVKVNDKLCQILGYSRDELLKLSWPKLTFPADLAKDEREFQRVISGDIEGYSIDKRFIHKNGEIIFTTISTNCVRASNGRIKHFVVVVQDIPEREQDNANKLNIYNLLKRAEQLAHMGSWEWDIHANTFKMSDEWLQIHGVSNKNIKMEELIQIAHPEDVEAINLNFQDALKGVKPYDITHRIIKQDTLEERVIKANGVVSFDNNGEPYKVLGTAQDITERTLIEKELEAHREHLEGLVRERTRDLTNVNEKLKQTLTSLEKIAHFDLLTNLPNRVLLADRLNQAMMHCHRRNKTLAVAFMDLDGFKEVNDTYGHAVGDKLLVAISNRMQFALREGDTLARIGGDEFIAVIVDLAEGKASEAVLDRLLIAASDPVIINNISLHVSVSIGVTIYPRDGGTAEHLIRHADQAMYAAKQAGKNRYHIFDVEHDNQIRTQRQNMADIRCALDRDELILHYQPKANMQTGNIVGFEALVRWQHPSGNLTPPLAFLPIIEGHALSVELGEWVIDTALKQIQQWAKIGIDTNISVNLSAFHLQQKNFTARLAALLTCHPEVNPCCLELEILETAALNDIGQISDIMVTCEQLGVRFALDDFGTGYSSLTYLKRLPAYLVKIDQSFVRDMLEDPEDLAIVEGVVGLAKAFRRKVIAEGVETTAQTDALLLMGCELAQGFGIAQPMPASEVVTWLADWKENKPWLRQKAH